MVRAVRSMCAINFQGFDAQIWFKGRCLLTAARGTSQRIGEILGCACQHGAPSATMIQKEKKKKKAATLMMVAAHSLRSVLSLFTF